MKPLLCSFHAIAAQRGDGLLPEFLALQKRIYGSPELGVSKDDVTPLSDLRTVDRSAPLETEGPDTAGDRAGSRR